MIAVAIIAVLFAWLDIWDVVALVGIGLLGLVVIIPAVIASPGRRLVAASWASSIQPAVVVFYLYATWAAAWCVLGHRPRPSLDDPKFISPIVAVPYVMFAASWTFGSILWFSNGLWLSTVCLVRRKNIGPLLFLPLAWLAALLALLWDPLGVLYWYMD
jgi:hypothetical protein